MLSYNEEHQKQITARHLIWPDAYGFVSEAVIGIVAVIIFNATNTGSYLLGTAVDTHEVFSYGLQPLDRLLDHLQQYAAVQQVLLFLLWAIVGSLIYVLVFRLAQIFLGVRDSVGQGVQYVQQEHARGIARWLASLHDFFLKAVVVLAGSAAIIISVTLCFGIASQELNNGLAEPFPGNIGSFVLSLVAAILSVRVAVIGISLLSPRFRRWYNT